MKDKERNSLNSLASMKIESLTLINFNEISDFSTVEDTRSVLSCSIKMLSFFSFSFLAEVLSCSLSLQFRFIRLGCRYSE
jgi:hypothetical protein